MLRSRKATSWPNAVLATALALSLAGCGGRPPADVLAVDPNYKTYRDTIDIFAASNRTVAHFADVETFANGRARAVGYEHISVSIPPNHKPGQIEWPTTGRVDPTTDFKTVAHEQLDRQQFMADVDAAAAARNGRVVVFVHGFNTLYQEAVYRFAQITKDADFKGTPVMFSWPSRGEVSLYLADRESVSYSRDMFEQFLIDLSRRKGVREINILGHSMGTLLVMETLEIMAIKGHRDLGGKLDSVVLASPDIDRDVFRRQLDNIGRLRSPLVVISSKNDSALAFASLLDGQNERVGLITAEDPAVVMAAKKYNVLLVDTTALKSSDPLNHTTFAHNQALLSAIGAGLSQPASEKAGALSVQQVGTQLLKLPVKAYQTVTGQ